MAETKDISKEKEIIRAVALAEMNIENVYIKEPSGRFKKLRAKNIKNDL